MVTGGPGWREATCESGSVAKWDTLPLQMWAWCRCDVQPISPVSCTTVKLRHLQVFEIMLKESQEKVKLGLVCTWLSKREMCNFNKSQIYTKSHMSWTFGTLATACQCAKPPVWSGWDINVCVITLELIDVTCPWEWSLSQDAFCHKKQNMWSMHGHASLLLSLKLNGCWYGMLKKIYKEYHTTYYPFLG